MNEKEKKFLLKLARDSIGARLKGNELKLDKVPETLKEKRGVFVTLTIKGELRGCIGHIDPIMPAYKAIAECAVSAAFHDPRFMPLTKKEFDEIKIEISILTIPKRLSYNDSTDLLSKLNPELGVILKKDYYVSTFLPQVWEELSDKEEFLSHLCMKAGLSADEWKKGELEVQTYTVEKFSE